MIRLKLLFISICWHSTLIHITAAWPTELRMKDEANFRDKKITIGAFTFYEFVEGSSVMVDKSLFIKRILEDKHKVLLITYPPRFCKSTNLKMLKTFVEMETDFEGNFVQPSETRAYSFFTKGVISERERGQTFGKPLLIAQHKDIVHKHLAQYPVMHFSWLGASTVDRKYNSFIEALKPLVVSFFTDHLYLGKRLKLIVNNNATNETYKEDIQEELDQYQQYALDRDFEDDTQIEDCFLWLSRVLYEQYGRKVILLMDDFVRVFDHMLLTDYTRAEEWKKVLEFMKNFISNTLNDNPYIEKAVITGYLPVNKEEMFLNISDFVHYNSFDGDLHDFYGFSRTEFNWLNEYFEIHPKVCKAVLKFYEGYTTKPNSNISIYDTHSVTKFLNSKNITNYWTGWIGFLEEIENWFVIEEFRNLMQSLVEGETVEIEYLNLNLTSKEILFPKKPVTWGQDSKLETHYMNTILTVLFDIGYLTIAKVHIDEQKLSQRRIILRIPNEEIRHVIRYRLKNRIHSSTTERIRNGTAGNPSKSRK